MQSKSTENGFHRRLHRSLNLKNILLRDKGVSGSIKIHIFDVQMRQERVTIPEGTVQFCSMIQPARTFFQRPHLTMERFALRSWRDVHGRSLSDSFTAKKLCDSQPNCGLGIVILPFNDWQIHGCVVFCCGLRWSASFSFLGGKGT